MRSNNNSNSNKKNNRRRGNYKGNSDRSPAKTYSGSYRPNRRNRSQYPASEMSKIYRRYDYLFDIYLAARKKYFEFYFRADQNQKPKLHKNYIATLKQLRDLERSLTKEQHFKLHRRNCTFKPDTTISSNSDQQQPAPSSEPATHHTLDSQFQCDYSNDREEGSGTMEDYKTLKGIS